MNATLQQVLSEFGVIVSTASVAGGCISHACQVDLHGHDGSDVTLFVKSNDSSFLDNFQCESLGLSQLRRSATIRVPRALRVTEQGGQVWFVSEWIMPGRRGADYFQTFARQLAALHRATFGDQYGWDRDNYLGAAPQINSRSRSWPDFVAEQRIGYQIRWAVDQGLAAADLRSDCQQIMDRMSELLAGRDDKSSLLHGDLWSGNYLCDDNGQPVIIDPAVYHGCREAELGMLRLFGSCPGEFYEAYQDALPMPAGWQRRVSVYVLYHLLNHLNLFGSGYLGQCRSLAAEILSS